MAGDEDGFRPIRAWRTTDETGRPVDLMIGLVEVHDQKEPRLEPAIKVDGKTALIPLEDIGSAVPDAIRTTLLEWWKREGR